MKCGSIIGNLLLAALLLGSGGAVVVRRAAQDSKAIAVLQRGEPEAKENTQYDNAHGEAKEYSEKMTKKEYDLEANSKKKYNQSGYKKEFRKEWGVEKKPKETEAEEPKNRRR